MEQRQLGILLSSETRNNLGLTLMNSAKIKTWVKRLGFWGFMFFLVKGLLWLLIPAVLAMLAWN